MPAGARLPLPTALLLLLQLVRLLARPIEYYDLPSRPLPALPDPPGLTLGPIVNASQLRETRDIAALADGASRAAPMQAWDLVVLRTFNVGPDHRIHTFLALLNIESGRIFHLDMGQTEGSMVHKRLTTGGAWELHGAWCGHGC